MKTELLYGSGVQRLCGFLDGFYKCGNVGVVSNGEDATLLTKALTACGHKVRTDAERFNDSVRCIIAFGEGALQTAEKYAVGKILIAYPTRIDYCTFLERQGVSRYTVYIDSEIITITDTENISSGYLNAMIALTELCGSRCLSALPYRDVEAERAARELKKVLSGEAERTTYFETLTKAIRDAAALASGKPLCERVCSSPMTGGEKFFVCYLFFYFRYLFTKYDFFGMLIPVGSPERFFGNGSDIPLSTQQLSCFAGRYFALGGDLDCESAVDILGMLPSALRKSNGFFAELGNSGILEATCGKW